jgi:multidrug efflux pump subunit AcrB
MADRIQSKVLTFKGVNSAEIDFEEGKEQVIVQIDEEEARRLGLTNKQIALELRHVVEGVSAIKIKEDSEDIDVIVKTDEAKLNAIEQLKNVFVTNSQGRSIQLSKFATFEKRKGIYLIRRFNRRRLITITGEINNELTTALEINKVIKEYLNQELKGNHDMRFELTGENKDTKESLDSFKKALVLSIAIIFVIIVIQFSSLTQPLIIMLTIPFGFIGVVFSFAILGLPIGFMALMGVLGLVGVVINDSIVLVTFINRLLIEEGESDASIIKGSLSRFRPVILTTFTTVAGLLPVAHATGGDPFLKPMATSFAYGLLFSSLITLLFVPACFKVILDFKTRKKTKVKRKE